MHYLSRHLQLFPILGAIKGAPAYNIYANIAYTDRKSIEAIMTIQEDACRWAYAKAMRIDSVRDTLHALGRAVYTDIDGDTALPALPDRYILSRVPLRASGRAIRYVTYCNGVHVAEA
jgi:hypothetical protein